MTDRLTLDQATETEVRAIELRKQVWEEAQTMVDIVLDGLELQDYKTGAAPFGYTTTMTVLDQRMSAIQNLADWLLGER